MADKKTDWDSVIQVRRLLPDGTEPNGQPTPLGAMKGPRGSLVYGEIHEHIRNGTTSGQVEVQGVTFRFQPKED